MRYQDPELLEALAREYVLGTLRGRARQRFERILGESADAGARVAAWQARFEALDDAVPPARPPDRVRRRLFAELGIGIGKDKQTAARRVHPIDDVTGGRGRARRGRGMAGLRTALAATLAAVIVGAGAWFAGVSLRPAAERVQPAFVSIVTTAEGEDVWAVFVYEDTSEVAVAVTGEVPALSDRVYELWMLPEGSPPRSLGLLPLLPVGETQRYGLTAAAFADLGRSSRLAVSVEPPGGSPTGVPTGDVVFVSALAMP